MAAEILHEIKRMVTHLIYDMESRQSFEHVRRELDVILGLISEVCLHFEDLDLSNIIRCLVSVSEIFDNIEVSSQEEEPIQCTLKNQITFECGRTGRPKIIIPRTQLEFLIYTANLKQKEIAELFGISVRTLSKRLSEYGIHHSQKFSAISDEELDSQIQQILINHPDIGYRSVRAHLLVNGENVQENRVREAVRRVDFEGCIMRRLTLLKPNRRKYNVKEANALWHIDGYHKLISWRMVIHGGIDGYSRLPVYLTVADNNRAETVLKSFMEAVREYGVPLRVRSDKGGENIEVAKFMVGSMGTGRGSHITGRSVHNQRIERFWRDLWIGCIGLFYNIFCSMEDQGVLLSTDELHLYSLHYVFLPRIQNHLDCFRHAFMRRPLRTTSSKSPIDMWTHSQIVNHSHSMTLEEVDEYGLCHEGLLPQDDFDSVQIHQNLCVVSDNINEELRNCIDPLRPSDSHGIDIFCETISFLQNKLAQNG